MKSLGDGLTVKGDKLSLDGKPLEGATVITSVLSPSKIDILLGYRAATYVTEIVKRADPKVVDAIRVSGLEKFSPSTIKRIVHELEDLGLVYKYKVDNLSFDIKEPQYSLVGWLAVYLKDKVIEPRLVVRGNDLRPQALERLPLLIKTAKVSSLRAPTRILKYLDKLRELGFDTSAIDQLFLTDDLICLPKEDTQFTIKVKENKIEPVNLSGLQLCSLEGSPWHGINCGHGITCNLKEGYLEIVRSDVEWEILRKALHSPKINGVGLDYLVADIFAELLRLAEEAGLEWISANGALLIRHAKLLKDNGYDIEDAEHVLRLTDELYLSGTIRVWVKERKVTARAHSVANVRGPKGDVSGMLYYPDGGVLVIREPTPYAAQAIRSPKTKRVRIRQSALEGSPLTSEIYFV